MGITRSGIKLLSLLSGFITFLQQIGYKGFVLKSSDLNRVESKEPFYWEWDLPSIMKRKK